VGEDGRESEARPGHSWLQALAPLAGELAALAPARLGEAVGSNNWVVDGSRTTTGKPLLANDPHLALSAPSQWYFAHLEAPGLSVIGATLPAAAGVILGRNAHVAWAFTNTHPDTEDVFIERLDPQHPERYLTPEGYENFERRRELIKVKGGAEVEHWVRSTRHGPVISDVSVHARGLTPSGHVLALRWTGFLTDDTTVAFPLRAARAGNAAELREAARSFHAPTQNIGPERHRNRARPSRPDRGRTSASRGWCPSARRSSIRRACSSRPAA
jgi:penicillin amidase